MAGDPSTRADDDSTRADTAATPADTAATRADATTRAETLAEAAVAGDRLALARLLTAVENRTPLAEAALRRLYPLAGRAHLVGITGPPGAGKSTLVAALLAELRAAGRPVAVVAVDPSSPITGGALLGDRVRMQAYAGDRDVFIRSMASRGHAGGLAATTTAAAAVLDAAGFDLVLIETVGTGQSEVEVAAAADTTVVLEAPEMGDEVQAIKAGLLEVADLIVVNKGDKPGAQRTAAQLRAMLVPTVGRATEPAGGHGPVDHHGPTGDHGSSGHHGPPDRHGPEGHHGPAGELEGHDGRTGQAPQGGTDPATPARPPALSRPAPKRPDVLVTTASTGEGVPELLAAIDRHRGAARDAAATTAARRTRAAAQVEAILAERLAERLRAPNVAERSAAIIDDVATHRLDPFAAADALLTAAMGEAEQPDREPPQAGPSDRP